MDRMYITFSLCDLESDAATYLDMPLSKPQNHTKLDVNPLTCMNL